MDFNGNLYFWLLFHHISFYLNQFRDKYSSYSIIFFFFDSRDYYVVLAANEIDCTY